MPGVLAIHMSLQMTWHCCNHDSSIFPEGHADLLKLAWCQAITWTNDDILSIRLTGTNFSKISIKIQIFSVMKTNFKVSSTKSQPFCPGPNVLRWPTFLGHLNPYSMCGTAWKENTICGIYLRPHRDAGRTKQGALCAQTKGGIWHTMLAWYII